MEFSQHVLGDEIESIFTSYRFKSTIKSEGSEADRRGTLHFEQQQRMETRTRHPTVLSIISECM